MKVKFRGKYPPGGPVIVRQEFERLGFEYAPLNTPNDVVNSFWVMRFEKEEIMQLKPSQKINFLPAMPEMCWKHLLHRNITRMKKQFGSEQFSFWPEGFELPLELESLKKDYETQKENGTFEPYIFKPTSNACGQGIRCIVDVDDLNQEDLLTKSVVQRYIMNPLLMDGFKVTFRIYVLITSFAPIKAYVYPEGLGRLCSQKYTNSKDSFGSLYTHLSNYDINKSNEEEFLKNKDSTFQTDSLRTDYQSVMQYLRNRGVNTDIVWEDIKDSIVKTLFSVDKIVGYHVSSAVPYKNNGFEVLGFDYLISDDYKCWLLEVNHAPNLEPHTELETKIKRAMIRDTLQLVDVTHGQSKVCAKVIEKLLEQSSQLKDHSFSSNDLWNFAQAEMENRRCGRWERVFPNKTSTKYFDFMTPSSSNKKVVEIQNNEDFQQALEKILQAQN